jgi:hypothetical protein
MFIHERLGAAVVVGNTAANDDDNYCSAKPIISPLGFTRVW